MARKKKFEEGTAEAFRKKKDLSKLTLEDAKAIMKELDKSYTEYKSKWLAAKTKESKNKIEDEYLSANSSDIERIKYVCKNYWDLIPGLMSIIDDVYYNMKYTQMQDKWEIMSSAKRKLTRRKNEHKRST